MQHKGDLIVDGRQDQYGQVTGTITVRAGGELTVHGQLAGGLIIEPGGRATVHGQVSRNVVNHGCLILHGQVCGRVLGNPPENAVGRDQIVGSDLEVPFRGSTVSWSDGD